MGTRADFYIGNDKSAEWIGSVAYDGHEFDEDKEHPIASAKTEEEFRNAVAAELAGRKDATVPSEGWPWPWNDSRTTDYAYMFFDGKVNGYCFGRLVSEKNDDEELEKLDIFPDMKAIKKVKWGEGSGIIIFSTPKD